jgi:hypothetical protein
MKYNIKDADGNITNIILADAEFVEANFEHYELWTDLTPALIPPTAEEEARIWRDMELSDSDYIVPLTDHPQHADYLSYRILLRNWPSTDSFPTTRPEL